MYILGINISHHCSLCLLKDGDIAFYLEEERKSKIKHHYPRIILEDLWTTRYRAESNNDFLMSGIRLETLSDILKITDKIDHIIFSSYGDKSDNYAIGSITKQINENFTSPEWHFYKEHHLYHACSGFYNSGFNNAVSIILDGGGFIIGDEKLGFYEQESVYLMDYSKITQVAKHFSNFGNSDASKNSIDFVFVEEDSYYSNTMSCGGMFNVITGLLGFNGEAGKTMGLAPYGDETKVPESWFYQDEKTGVWRTDTKSFSSSLEQRFDFEETLPELARSTSRPKVSESVAADLARKTQVETLDHTIRLIEKYTKETGEQNVVLSGGYFLNCSNNYQYLKRFPDLRFFVDPVAHDGGTAIGAAKYLWHKLTGDTTVRKLETLYLG